MSKKAIGQFVSKIKFKADKHSPEIFMIFGIGSLVCAGVLACRSTLKAHDVLDQAKLDVETIHKCAEDELFADQYSDEDRKKDLAITYANTGVEIAKLYALPVGLGAVGIACTLKSHDILNKRNIALAAAYTTIDKSFKQYREHVVDRFGETVDKELKYGIKAKKVTETVVDEETGKSKKQKKTVYYRDTNPMPSEYARFLEEYTRDAKGNVVKNKCWENDPQLMLKYILIQQDNAQRKLEEMGYFKLNDAYRMFDLPESQAGNIMGWLYDKNDPELSKTRIDFGVFDSNQNFSDFIYDDAGKEALLLDFHVTHNVYETLPKY